MKLIKKLLPILIIIISFILGLYFYAQAPDLIVSHWNAQGQADGYMGKFWGIFLLPITQIILYLLLIIVPLIDPKRENIQKFRGYYDNFIILFMAYMLGVFGFTLAWNFGHQISIISFMVISFAILFYYLGCLLEKAEPNWSIGIRTAWTMESPTVWKKTHTLGGKLYKIIALISLLSLLIPKISFIVTIGGILLVSFYLVIYSYVAFRNERRKT